MEDIYEYLRITANLVSESRFRDLLIFEGYSSFISEIIEIRKINSYKSIFDKDIRHNTEAIWKDFYTNIENILNNNQLGIKYRITERQIQEKEYETTECLKFELLDTNLDKRIKFKIDAHIKREYPIECKYSIILDMSTYGALTLLSDRIVSVSSDKIFTQTKDLYDLCILVSAYNIKYSDITNHLSIRHPKVQLKNMLESSNFKDIEHAYSNYTDIKNKPDIAILINVALTFLYPIYQKIERNMIWDNRALCWMED